MRFKGWFLEMSFEKVCKKTGFFQDDWRFLMKKWFFKLRIKTSITNKNFL